MESQVLLEDIIGAKNKVKLLRLLIKNELISFSEIRKKLGLNHSVLKEYLNTLEKAGIVRVYKVSRFRIYGLRKDNPKVRYLIKLFEVWDLS